MSQVALIEKFLSDQSSVTEEELAANAAASVPTTNTNSPEYYAGLISAIVVGCLKNSTEGITPSVRKELDYLIAKYYGALEV